MIIYVTDMYVLIILCYIFVLYSCKSNSVELLIIMFLLLLLLLLLLRLLLFYVNEPHTESASPTEPMLPQ